MSSFSLADLCDLADVTPRTVRFYIAQGLLRPPTGAGPAARYEDGHLDRLRLIRRLQKEHLPLVEIRRRLDALSDADVAQIANGPSQVSDTAADYVARVLGARGVGPAPDASWAQPSVPIGLPPPAGVAEPPAWHALPSLAVPPQAATPDPEPSRSQWERIVLTPEIELHIRRPLSRNQNRRVDRLVEAARLIFKEEDQ